ncbi:MAG: hypothetical protein ACOX67_03375 [Oscillospiraceae bacterium]|jgi:hypothetical protein
MEVIGSLLFLMAAGAAAAALLRFLRRSRPTALPRPGLFFLAILGAAANNTAAVLCTGADALLPSGGGFLGGDRFNALFTGMTLALFALPGILVCAIRPVTGEARPQRPLPVWVWGWILSQGALSAIILLLGFLPGYRPFSDRESYGGLPLWGYLILMTALHLLAGWLVGQRLPGPAKKRLAATFTGCGALCLISALLLVGMLAKAVDPTWGLSLMQTPCGTWYGRLALPAALLLGDYQYAWDITVPGLWCSVLLPHLLFAAGSAAAILRKRGNEHD